MCAILASDILEDQRCWVKLLPKALRAGVTHYIRYDLLHNEPWYVVGLDAVDE
jgi:hypothetical protein